MTFSRLAWQNKVEPTTLCMMLTVEYQVNKRSVLLNNNTFRMKVLSCIKVFQVWLVFALISLAERAPLQKTKFNISVARLQQINPTEKSS
jgi:hypothetical protein